MVIMVRRPARGFIAGQPESARIPNPRGGQLQGAITSNIFMDFLSGKVSGLVMPSNDVLYQCGTQGCNLPPARQSSSCRTKQNGRELPTACVLQTQVDWNQSRMEEEIGMEL